MLNIESSNKVIDDLYDLGLKSGAVGGKLLGAGGGGFILFCVPEDLMSNFKSKMKKFKSVNFEIDDTGPSVFKLGN
jgi:D-glycero-alpha-D-manno-heptose-7-phosphate kinase